MSENSEAPEKKITLEEAKAAIAQERQDRADRCLKDLQMVLAEHHCYWDVKSHIDNNKVLQSVIVIVPKDI